MALLVTVMVLLMVSAIGVAAISHSGAEFEFSGRSRAAKTTFYAADGGIELAQSRLAQTPPRLDAFNVTYTDGSTVRSGARTDATAQPLIQAGSGPPPEGFGIGVGSGFGSSLYRTRVTAFHPVSGSVELEAKYTRFEAAVGAY